jgi:hypothetical protein
MGQARIALEPNPSGFDAVSPSGAGGYEVGLDLAFELRDTFQQLIEVSGHQRIICARLQGRNGGTVGSGPFGVGFRRGGATWPIPMNRSGR